MADPELGLQSIVMVGIVIGRPRTPGYVGLVIDDTLVSSGRIPTRAEVRQWLATLRRAEGSKAQLTGVDDVRDCRSCAPPIAGKRALARVRRRVASLELEPPRHHPPGSQVLRPGSRPVSVARDRFDVDGADWQGREL